MRLPRSYSPLSSFRTALLLGSGLLAASKPAPAQSDSSRVARGTLRGWEQQVRFAIFDRGGSFHGRLSELGILQRFNEDMDSEYDLDVISSSFSPTEDHSWYRLESGARFWSGSIDHLRQVQRGEFKTSIGLGSSWAVDAALTYEETLMARRALPTIAFSRALSDDESRVFLRGTLNAVKPDADIELGVDLTPATGRLTVAVAALDLFSDLNYQLLEVDPRISETAIDHTSHPFTLRTSLDMPIGSRTRVEAHGLVLTPTRLLVESQTEPGDGFAQDERYAYAGALTEWEARPGTAIGAIATWVRARTEREPLPAGSPDDDFVLTEKTWRLGPYGMVRMHDRLRLEAWLSHVWRTEDRVLRLNGIGPENAGTLTNRYEDRTWAGRNSLIYKAKSGFNGTLGLDFTARRTSGPTPVQTLEPLDADNFRLRLDVGWQFASETFLLFGANLDLDDRSFDGGHGRFRLAW